MSYAPYDLIAEEWVRERHALRFREKPYIDRFLALTVPGAHILDLGCGAAAPIARYLLDRGYRLTGVDASPVMLRLARINCPEAEFVAGDMSATELTGPYHGIVAWDSIFHIPKAQHKELFHTLSRWLAPHAPLLLSLGGSEGEFSARMFGIDFFYSAHAPEVSLAFLQEAGFEILCAEIDDPSSRGHLAVLCRKTAHSPLT
jgi:cyclopropane fatty-acyl-phospholipid synthase-like methyltransferase